MGTPEPDQQHTAAPGGASDPSIDAIRDIAEVSAAELVMTLSLHLMSAAAVKVGLSEDGETELDLAEARIIITGLAGLVVATAPDLDDTHARSLRDGLRTLQLAFREASPHPDAPGKGPGEKYTGSVI